MSQYSRHGHARNQRQETDLVGLLLDVLTGLGELLRGCPRRYRELKKGVAIMSAEIQSLENLHVRTLRESFKRIAKDLNSALRSDFVNAKYRQLMTNEEGQRIWPFTFLRTWVSGLTDGPQKIVERWTQTQYSCLEMLREILQSPLRHHLQISELLSGDSEVIKRLTSSVTVFNELVEQLDSGYSQDEDSDLTDNEQPQPAIGGAAFRGETSIRHLSQLLYQILHENWPCQLEEHDHGGKLGCCVEAKFCLDPQWNVRGPDLPRGDFFVMLTGSGVIQECRVGLHTCDADKSGTLACLVDSEESRTVCLQLSKDSNNRLWGQRLGQPLEVLQFEEDYDEGNLESLGKLLETLKPTHAAKRVMGLILARSVLHLLKGPWISWSLSINDISLFCRPHNDDLHPLFDRVFLSTIFKGKESGSQDGRRNPFGIHPFPTILALGIVLAEIELGEELAEIYSQPSFSGLRKKPYALAQKLWKECRHRFHWDTGVMRTINFCVNDRNSFLPFANMDSERLFSNESFVQTYYKKAVKPLEEDLIKGANWTWDEVNWVERRDLDNHGVCKIMKKRKSGVAGNGKVSTPENKQKMRTKSSEYASGLASIPEANDSLSNTPQDAIGGINPGPIPKTYNYLPMDMKRPLQPKTRGEFEMAIICALPLEAGAVLATFDHLWDEGTNRYGKAANDPNFYSVGVMGGQNVVLAHQRHIGKATAANVAAACAMSFTNVKLALLVGVCGGVPFKQNNEEILLGDVVVSKGVIQYDHGRQFSDQFVRKIDLEASLGRPDARTGSFLAAMQTPFYRAKVQMDITTLLNTLDEEVTSYPGEQEDKLFKSSYRHKHHDFQRCRLCASCLHKNDPVCSNASELSCREIGCENTMLINRRRKNQRNRPTLHIGLIASGDGVVRSSAHRDQLAEEENIIAFEMEGAGVWDTIPCVVIKGVCDYADSHKNKQWQKYAATTAAACTRSFIQYWQQGNTAG